MSVTVAETKRVEQLEDALGSRVLEMTTMITERLPYFRRIAVRYLENAADAEDAVQDALLSAWKHLGEFKGHAQLSTWLTTIVVNSALTILRKRARLRLLSIEGQDESDNHALFAQHLPDHRPGPEVQFWNSEYERWLHQLFMHLSPALRVVIHMRIVEGLSIREIAEALGLTESAVKSRTARAGAQLRRLARETSSGSLRVPRPAARATNGFAPLTPKLNAPGNNHRASHSCQKGNEHGLWQPGALSGALPGAVAGTVARAVSGAAPGKLRRAPSSVNKHDSASLVVSREGTELLCYRQSKSTSGRSLQAHR